MRIGEKIKKIRTSKLLTQKQLAGDQITRNMLSRIENGAAYPSLQTVIYLAGRLNVSPAFLLAEGEDEILFRKIYKIENIKHAYRNGDMRICRDLCRSSGIEDDEIYLIIAQCSLKIAKEEFATGKLRSSGRFFEEAVEYAAKSVYNNDIFRAEATVYFRYMRQISPTLGGELGGKAVYEGLSYGDPFCAYAVTLEGLSKITPINKDISTFTGSDIITQVQQPFAAHIHARAEMLEKRYKDAADLLGGILTSQAATPDPFLYNVFCDLEICSREIEDFKNAYEYAAVKVNLLERLLSEIDA